MDAEKTIAKFQKVIDRVLFTIVFLLVFGLTLYNGRRIDRVIMNCREIKLLHSHPHHNHILGGHNPPHVLSDYLPKVIDTNKLHKLRKLHDHK